MLTIPNASGLIAQNGDTRHTEDDVTRSYEAGVAILINAFRSEHAYDNDLA